MNLAPRRDDQGASAVEYGLMVAAIAGVIIVILFAVGSFTNSTYSDTCASLAAGDFSGQNTCP